MPRRPRRHLTRVSILLTLLLAPGIAAPAETPEAPRGLRTIVLDPGHGGDDLGVVASSGLSERDVASEICRRIARIVSERLGTPRVVITHDREAALDLPGRTSLANGRKGDLLLSIHAAGSARASASGAHVWVMGSGLRVVELSERRLRPRARRLVTGIGAEGADADLRLTPWALAQDEFLPASRALAERISRELAPITGQAPVGELPLAVLGGARMPAVLVEVGHLTHAEDAEHLESDRYRESVAAALFRGFVGLVAPADAAAASPPDPAPDGE